MIANARMYAVTPDVEAAWRILLDHVFADAGLEPDYLPYPAPAPLEDLWARADLGAVLMCGYPIALGMGDITPIAAPIPATDWAAGEAVYRSDLIVRADSPFHTLADTFGGRLGWTAAHSHSGYNALRHHLFSHRTPERPSLYGAVVGDLVTPRAVIDAVLDGRIDVGPLDAYWGHLFRRARPDVMASLRVVDSTPLAKMPAFVGSAHAPPETIAKVRAAFAAAASRDWFPPLAEALQIAGFEPVGQADYDATLAWDVAARAAGYPAPA